MECSLLGRDNERIILRGRHPARCAVCGSDMDCAEELRRHPAEAADAVEVRLTRSCVPADAIDRSARLQTAMLPPRPHV